LNCPASIIFFMNGMGVYEPDFKLQLVCAACQIKA
jgi:hypothetical protein